MPRIVRFVVKSSCFVVSWEEGWSCACAIVHEGGAKWRSSHAYEFVIFRVYGGVERCGVICVVGGVVGDVGKGRETRVT